MNIISEIENKQIAELTNGKEIPSFKAGDTLKVHLKVVEGDKERIQIFEGMCIARKNKGLNSSFTVRKISFGEGVEKVFPLYSPKVEKIEVIRVGTVRRAKLYYLRNLRGKKARITENVDATRKILSDNKNAKAAAKKAEMEAKKQAEVTEKSGSTDAPAQANAEKNDK